MGRSTSIPWCDHIFNPWGAEDPPRRTSEANWKQPLKWDRAAAEAGIRRRVFCASVADVFDPEVMDRWRHDLMGLIHATPHLTWLILTKRPKTMRRFVVSYSALPTARWPANIWLGVSVEDQASADARIPILLSIPAAVRFVSAEPLLAPVDFECYPSTGCPTGWLDRGGLDWIIVGGESGPKARPFDIAWARSTIRQCRKASVKVYAKQLGRRPIGACIIRRDEKGADPSEWPEDLRVREMP